MYTEGTAWRNLPRATYVLSLVWTVVRGRRCQIHGTTPQLGTSRTQRVGPCWGRGQGRCSLGGGGGSARTIPLIQSHKHALSSLRALGTELGARRRR